MDDFVIYSTAHSFMTFPVTKDLTDADVVVLGAACDFGTMGRGGTRQGPEAVRRISGHVSWEEKRWPWRFKLRDHLNVIDYGDIACFPGRLEEFREALQGAAREILAADKTLLTIGGDHYITLPLLREHAAKHGPLSLLHFDAHTDTEQIDQEFYHGNMFRMGLQEGIIHRETSIQVGIRTELNDPPTFALIDADQLCDWPLPRVIEKIERVVGDTPVYLSFDIDCLDPAYAPGTGTPVPGGPSSNKMIQLIRALVGIEIVGMDIVEINPAYDPSEVTALAGCALAAEFLHLQACSRNPDLPRP